MLESVRDYFGVGSVRTDTNNALRYLVTGLKDCLIIRDHFLKFPLMSFKVVKNTLSIMN
jgi:LAGLIDADG endonuclease